MLRFVFALQKNRALLECVVVLHIASRSKRFADHVISTVSEQVLCLIRHDEILVLVDTIVVIAPPVPP
jgi:hypothetical protein